MIDIVSFPIIPYLAPGSKLQPDSRNNNTNWLRTAINLMMNRHKAELIKAGVNIDLFHNHDTQREQNLSVYPKIQYQRRGNRYFVLGIDEGKYALEQLLGDCPPMVYINDNLALKIGMPVVETYMPLLTEESFICTLTDWLPFSDDSDKEFVALTSLAEKMLFLENRLKNHIVSDFCRFLGIVVNAAAVQVAITAIDSLSRPAVLVEENKRIRKYQPFTVNLLTNLPLPANVCLGNKKVYGYGLVDQTTHFEPAPFRNM